MNISDFFVGDESFVRLLIEGFGEVGALKYATNDPTAPDGRRPTYRERRAVFARLDERAEIAPVADAPDLRRRRATLSCLLAPEKNEPDPTPERDLLCVAGVDYRIERVATLSASGRVAALRLDCVRA